MEYQHQKNEIQITEIQHKLSDGRKRLDKRYGTISLPPGPRHKKYNKKT